MMGQGLGWRCSDGGRSGVGALMWVGLGGAGLMGEDLGWGR